MNKICVNKPCTNTVKSKLPSAKYCSPKCQRIGRYNEQKANGYFEKWRAKNRDKLKIYHKKYREKPEVKEKRKQHESKPEIVLKRRIKHLKARYGVSLEEYNVILESQKNLCAICGGPLTRAKGKLPHIDHDHDTGKVRGILCAGCNHGLGYVEKLGWVELARDYLERY